MRIHRLTLVAILAAMPALAGRPLSTEDASTLGAKACQVECSDRSSNRRVASASSRA